MRGHAMLAGVVMCGLMASGASAQFDVFSNFESFSPNTPVGSDVVLGTSPEDVTFSGDDQFAGRIGVGSLYRSGVRAWMAQGQSDSTITFGTDASEVNFFARTRSGSSGSATIRAFDGAGAQIGADVVIPGPASFQEITFMGEIATIEIDNNALPSGNGGIFAIEDFGVTFVDDADCAADFNGDGDGDVTDLLDFLQLWFISDLGADFDEDLDVDVSDLLAFLAVWFPGC